MAQFSETEAVLGLVARRLDPSININKEVGRLLKDVRRLLSARGDDRWNESLQIISRAKSRRNHAVHSSVTIGSSWTPYATGGGDWIAVISLMGSEEYDEIDRKRDLALQHDATAAAVQLFHSLY